METDATQTPSSENRVAHTLQLAHEIERVLSEMEAELSAAEAKLARNRQIIARGLRRKSAAT